MPETARRVVLLARPGPARDRVRAALSEVAAELALEADPTQAGVDEVAAAGAQLVIVVLDGPTEAALERFDAVLLDPAVDVMYEEAELAAARSGWDAARWTRHLAAKLHGHGDVLPPGPVHSEPMDAHSMRPDAELDAQISDAIAAPAADADDSGVAGFDPTSADALIPPGEAEPAAAIEWDAPVLDLGGADLADASGIEQFTASFDPVVPHPLSDAFTPGVEPGAFAGFDPVAAEMAEIEFDADQVITFDASLREDFAPSESTAASPAPGFDLAFESELVLPDASPSVVQSDASQFQDFSLDDLRTESVLPPVELPEPAFDVLEAEPARGAGAVTSGFAGLSDGHVLALVTDDAPAPGPAAPPAANALADLEHRIASLSLVEHVEPRSGAVLLVAGLGGPDAVRQVLGALPEGFPRPVLVQQRLDGGRYDRLVTQLQRATSLPVDLADPGADARPGVVYVLPDGVGLQSGPDGLRFDDADPLDALPPADSAVLLLSGADASLATRLAANTWSQAFVAGQSAEGCYDATASNALAERGRPTASPADLARQLAERWAA